MYVFASQRKYLFEQVFQRRVDKTMSFERNWTDYADGFGDLLGNFLAWLVDKNRFFCMETQFVQSDDNDNDCIDVLFKIVQNIRI